MIPPWLALAFVLVCIVAPVAMIALDRAHAILADPEEFIPTFDREDER